MKNCKCNGKYSIFKNKTKDGLTYNYYKCIKCNESFLDMKQLHEVAEKYKNIKKLLS